MTLAEGKKKVYELLDEYSSGGSVTRDADLEAKMADFFDIAQKQMANVQRIVKTTAITRVSGQTEYAMPGDFAGVYRIWYGGRVKNNRFDWKAGKIIIPAEDTETVEVEYFAIPATVNASTDDTYKFEVREDACQAMCFFVAAQQLVVDLVIDYGALLNLYQMALANVDTGIPGGQMKSMQTFFRG